MHRLRRIECFFQNLNSISPISFVAGQEICLTAQRSASRVRFRFVSWKNRFFWSKIRYFESILCYSIFIRTDSSPSESEPEWTSQYSAIRNFDTDDFFLGTWFFPKMLLEIGGNFSNTFYNGFFKKPYKNIVGFSYLLALVITKIITIFEN